jgi:tRNA (guanine37-N1)-methyltransferase
MRIDILTLFPDMVKEVFTESIIKRAVEKGHVIIKVHDLRDWTTDKRRTVDDKPYGGGPGMIIKVEPVDKALSDLRKGGGDMVSTVILLTPQGERYTQGLAKELAGHEHLILVCGHYEGFDERIRVLADREISIGDFVMTGGEIPAMAVTDSVVRLIPGVLGESKCLEDESFERGLLEYPQYTRPAEYKGMKVPEILQGGDHKKIDAWRKEKAEERTLCRRPDLDKC